MAAPKSGPAPRWVEASTPPTPSSLTDDDRKNGVVYRLIERQINTATKEEFHRSIYTVTSSEGVQNLSQVRLSWEPGYQVPTVHTLKLSRDGQTRERRPSERFQTMRRESSLQRHVLDGTLTAVALLEAVEPGDTIEFAWSVKGANPVFQGLFARVLPWQLESRIEAVDYRLLHEAKRIIAHKERGPVPTSHRQASKGALTEHRWQARDVRPPIIDDGTPSWMPMIGTLELSEFPSWAEVAKWGRQLFPPKPVLGSELAGKLAEIQRSGEPAEVQIGRAVTLVQDQVRYLSLAIGAGTHRPALPEETFRRRYGDCKDKSLLLAALLRELGHDAAPALVDSDGGVFLHEGLPSPLAFDHAIVRLRFGGETYWIDPTSSHQGTGLGTRHVADFRQALVLAEGESGLTPVARGAAAANSAEVNDVISSTAFDKPADLTSTYIYRGSRAESARGYFAGNDQADLAKRGLEFIRRYYPGATEVAPVRWVDDRTANQLVVVERYLLPNFWKTDDKGVRTAHLHPTLFYTTLSKTGATKRSAPLALIFPQVLVQRISVNLPEEWSKQEKKETISDAGFTAELRHEIEGRRAFVEYRWVTRKDCVEPGEVTAHASKLASFLDDLGMSLTYGADSAAAAAPAEEMEPLARPASFLVWASAALLSSIVLFILCRTPISRSRLYRAEEIPANLHGFGGWLIIPALTVHFGALLGLVSFFASKLDAHDPKFWARFASPGGREFEPAYAEFAYAELTILGAISAFAFFALVLFWRKHHRFPLVMIWFYVLIQLFGWVGVAAHSYLKYPTPAQRWEARVDVFRDTAAAALWITYLLRSRRVAATFVRGGGPRPWEAVPALPAAPAPVGTSSAGP